MRQYGAHVHELKHLVEEAQSAWPWPTGLRARVFAALDGQAAAKLRTLVPLADRRRAGAFFTSSDLSAVLLDGIQTTSLHDAKIFDPACGAGNLLVAAVPHAMSSARTRQPGIERQAPIFEGMDISEEFVRAARLRLHLALLAAGEPNPESAARITRASTLDAHSGYASASHVLLNPPFSGVPAPSNCGWATGTVNAAAVFALNAVERTQEGTEIRAILPDVLRSGSRYKRWRRLVDEQAEVSRLVRYGRFDRWTDVDVFVLELIVRSAGTRETSWMPKSSGRTIGDLFELSVGPVVHFRDPLEGGSVPYLVARDLPVWTTVEKVERTRAWTGLLTGPPFVAIRRTSSSGEHERARATLLNTHEPVAVDNHLIVCKPRDGSVPACEQLMQLLRSPHASRWLDRRIRCRHLTLDSVAGIPWEEEQA